MAVYVDDFKFPAKVGRLDSLWSNIVADTHDELIEFAKGLGLNIGWIQRKGTWKEHFSVTESVRKKAIAAGAVPVAFGGSELKEVYARKRDTGTY